LYWHGGKENGWQEFTLHGLQPLDPDAVTLHLSYFEADAYARWAGARLPTEFEWELAAASIGDPKESPPTNARPGPQQMFGTAWQWTSSSYAPYAGYVAADGAIGEYNGKFMVNQYVLRGSSCATPEGHGSATYRNFFPAGARWQFSGIRLAKSGPA
jgi:formylglycine-generating enzyme required for sulfatase activity